MSGGRQPLPCLFVKLKREKETDASMPASPENESDDVAKLVHMASEFAEGSTPET